MSLSFARWPATTQTREATRFIGDVVLEIAAGGRSPADRTGTSGMPDLSQVPQLDPRLMAPGLEAMVAVFGGDRVERDEQVRPAFPGP